MPGTRFIEARLKQINELIYYYEAMTNSNYFHGDYQKRVSELTASLSLIGNDPKKIKLARKESKNLLKEVGLAILYLIIHRLDAELKHNSNDKIKKFKAHLEEIRATFERNYEINILEEKFLIESINTMVTMTKTPLAELSQNISLPPRKRRKKPRLVKIEDMPNLEGELAQKQATLLAEIGEQAHSLSILEKEFEDLIGFKPSKDPLISFLQNKVQASKQKFYQTSHDREVLKREIDFLNLASTNFFPVHLDKVKTSSSLDRTKEEKIMEFVHYFQEVGLRIEKKIGIETFLSLIKKTHSDALRQQDLDFIQKIISFLKEKYQYKTRHQLNERILEEDLKFSLQQKTYTQAINDATQIIRERLDELEQIEGKVTKSTGTERGLANLLSILNHATSDAQAIGDDLKQQYSSVIIIQEEKDSDIRALFEQLGEIRREVKKFVKIINDEFQLFEAADAFHHTPLEADRLIKKIASTKQLIENLVKIQEQHVAVLQQLKEAIAERESAGIVASFVLGKEIERVLINLAAIEKNIVYQVNFPEGMTVNMKAELDGLKKEIHGVLEQKPMTISKEDISSFRESSFEKIQGIEQKLKEELYRINTGYIEQLRPAYDLSIQIENGLSEHKSLFGPLFRIANEYNRLIRSSKDEILHFKFPNMPDCDSAIKSSNDLFQEIQKRKRHPLVKIVDDMLKLLEEEINSESTEIEFSKKEILKELEINLSAKLKDFEQLKTQPSVAICEFTNVLMEGLSKDKLRKLSNQDQSLFTAFMRKLLEPLITFIKKLTGEKFRANFFADDTELKIARTAQTAYASLKSLLRQYDSSNNMMKPK